MTNETPDTDNKPRYTSSDFLEPAEAEKYRVQDSGNISRILRDLVRNPELVTIYFDDRKHFLISAIIGIDDKQLYLDLGRDEVLNQRMLESTSLTIVSRHQKVYIEFACEQASKTIFNNEPSLAVPLPSSIIKLQRREYYRLTTPQHPPVICHLSHSYGKQKVVVVNDISLGGISFIITMPEEFSSWRPNMPINECVISLPEYEDIKVTVDVKGLRELSVPNGGTKLLIGCQFAELQAKDSAAIQRYIHSIELQRRRQ